MRRWLTTILACLPIALGGCRATETKMAKQLQSTPTLWVLEQRKLWGDYGDVLISGYARRETESGPLALHRTGPFLPPVSFPWITNTAGHAVVVSAEFRGKLERLKLPGLEFREAGKSRIIPLSWERWDLTAKNPKHSPDGGEPENFMWDEQHDAACAAKMSDAFEVVPPVGPVSVERVEDSDGGYLDEFTAERDANPADVPPMSRSHPTHGYVIVNDELKLWLEENAGEWVRFSPVRPAKAASGKAG
jgi:hypothetical protein